MSRLRRHLLASTSHVSIHRAWVARTRAEHHHGTSSGTATRTTLSSVDHGAIEARRTFLKNGRRPVARTASYCARGWQVSDTQAQQAVRVEGSIPSNSTNSREIAPTGEAVTYQKGGGP
jgi:hypothetical protein